MKRLMEVSPMKIPAVLLTIISTLAVVQAERFEGRGVKYKTPGGQWIRASIEIEPGRLDVRDRKGQPVAAFTTAAVEHEIRKRRRSNEALNVLGAGTSAMLMAVLTEALLEASDEKRGQRHERVLGGKELVIGLSAIDGAVAAIAMTKKKFPYGETRRRHEVH